MPRSEVTTFGQAWAVMGELSLVEESATYTDEQKHHMAGAVTHAEDPQWDGTEGGVISPVLGQPDNRGM